MTKREKEIYELIGQNPMLSQNEISEKLGITRSSVGVYISSLMKKGNILGKSYILKNTPYVVVVGIATIDLEGYPAAGFKIKEPHPGIVKKKIRGAGKNLAENFAMVNIDTKFITLVGDDSNGKDIINNCQKKGIDVSYSEVIKGQNTSTSISILGTEKDMKKVILDTNIMEKLDKELILKKANIIKGSEICIIDTNIPRETIEFILNNYDTSFIVDIISSGSSKKLIGLYSKIDLLKLGLPEVEAITGMKIKNEEDIFKASKLILNLGVKKVFISIKEKGIYYANSKKNQSLKLSNTEVVDIKKVEKTFLLDIVAEKIKSKVQQIRDCYLEEL